jgi:hypothetical protein
MGASGALGAATMLAVLKHAKAHGEITAVFAAGDGSAHSSGAESDSQTFTVPEGSLLIGIGETDTGVIATSAPMAAILEAGMNTGATIAGHGRAYVIAASGFSSGATDDGDRVNPVTVVARVLSEAKSAGCAYGLVGFSGGSDSCAPPSEARAVVILGDYEERQFRGVFKKIARESIEAAGGDDSGADVSMIETTRPDSAVDDKYASDALSYIYGLMRIGSTGSGDSSGAVVNIGRVALTPSSFECGLSVTGDEAEDVERVVNEQFAIGRLIGMPVRKVGEIQGFGFGGEPGDERPVDAAAAALEKAYSEVTGDDVSEGTLAAAGPFGQLAQTAVVRCIGVTVDDAGTTEESFLSVEAAVPANVIMKYLEL